MHLALSLCLFSLIFQHSDARPSFVSRIPNGNNVNGVNALGHVNSGGGGATNAFGEAFEAAGTSWTKELCESDSDGDSATNGEELGDPCCTWTTSSGFDRSSTSPALQSPSHPGVANSFTADELSTMTCGGEADNIASNGAASTLFSSASGSQSSTQVTSSSESSFADVVVPDDKPRFSPRPKLDAMPQSPATSGSNKLQSVLVAAYCLSAAIALAL